MPLVLVGGQSLPRLGGDLHREPKRSGPLIELPDRQPPRHGAEFVHREQDLPPGAIDSEAGQHVDQRSCLRFRDRGLRRALDHAVPRISVREAARAVEAGAEPPPQRAETQRRVIDKTFFRRTYGG
ncbi:MAG TPA: hypothetical protein VF070_49685 [Streptosporangiaceae bacterium]